MENEALVDFLINKSSNLLNNPKTHEKDLKYTLKKVGNKINLVVEKKDGSGKKIIESGNLRLEGEFYGKQVIRVRDVRSLTLPPKTA